VPLRERHAFCRLAHARALTRYWRSGKEHLMAYLGVTVAGQLDPTATGYRYA
jgi:hypothetical protein